MSAFAFTLGLFSLLLVSNTAHAQQPTGGSSVSSPTIPSTPTIAPTATAANSLTLSITSSPLTYSLFPPYPVSSSIQVNSNRNFYASIVEVKNVSTVIYAITCQPTSGVPSTDDVCGTSLVGSDSITVTRDETTRGINWFTATVQASGGPATHEVQCSRTRRQKRYRNSCSWTNDGSVVSATDGPDFETYGRAFSAVSSWDVTITAGQEKIPSQWLPTSTTRTGTPAPAPFSTGAAPKATGAVSNDVLLGAAGIVGAAMFGP